VVGLQVAAEVLENGAGDLVVLLTQDLQRDRVQALVRQGVDDGEEDLLLAREVLVEGPRRGAGGGGDVGDPRIEEPVALEDLLRCADEMRARRLPARRPGPRRDVPLRTLAGATTPSPARRTADGHDG